MTNQHPITPPPELVEEWLSNAFKNRLSDGLKIEQVATQAARWGSDQELEACCDWLDRNNQWARCDIDELHDARRPKPQSLKEQALEALYQIESECPIGSFGETIRRALEQLDD